MDPTQVSPEILAMLQALQGNTPQGGMAQPQQMPPGGPNDQIAQPGMQASLGNGMLAQQAPNMYGPLASPPPMTPPPAPIY